ncbi:hypothetical protein [Prevotella koreensis]|uniref:hypothetical protein n=1 Tax=Prevotella koreensis TaxID=2490854 RepID=UPI003FA17074
MRNVKIILGLFVLHLFAYSQNTFNKKDVFTYKTPHYYESIELLENGSFVYYSRSEFIKTEVKGNWQLRDDSILVLYSRPQRSRITVFESRKRSKKSTFQIRNTDNHHIHYNLYLITIENDTLEYKDQFDKTAVLGNFSSFYVVDTKGQYYPTYKILGSRSNIFYIMIEEKRVFENEYWKYYGEYLVPLGIDGKYSNYKLVKNQRLSAE